MPILDPTVSMCSTICHLQSMIITIIIHGCTKYVGMQFIKMTQSNKGMSIDGGNMQHKRIANKEHQEEIPNACHMNKEFFKGIQQTIMRHTTSMNRKCMINVSITC